jgi:hypothetical protein
MFPAVVAVLLAGCGSIPTRTIDAQTASAVRNQSVLLTAREKPGFMATSATNVAFGYLGVAASYAEGKKLIADNNVADPADAIAAALSEAMHATHGAQLVAQPLKVETTDPARIAELAKGKARFVLDVWTANWNFMYFPTNWTHYRVQYVTGARLIDVESQRVVAEAECQQLPDSDTNAPTYDEMVAGGAARLKAILAGYAQTCAAKFGRDLLALQEPVRMPGVALAATAVPAQRPAPVAASAVAVATGNWNGVMACDARADSGARAEAYEARFAVDVQGNTVTVHRRTADVTESLSGEMNGNRLELHGTGHRFADPARAWRLDISGDFPSGAASYQGKGSMSANGRQIRKCELRLTRA